MKAKLIFIGLKQKKRFEKAKSKKQKTNNF
jgi:hypothetical protein